MLVSGAENTTLDNLMRKGKVYLEQDINMSIRHIECINKMRIAEVRA